MKIHLRTNTPLDPSDTIEVQQHELGFSGYADNAGYYVKFKNKNLFIPHANILCVELDTMLEIKKNKGRPKNT